MFIVLQSRGRLVYSYESLTYMHIRSHSDSLVLPVKTMQLTEAPFH